MRATQAAGATSSSCSIARAAGTPTTASGWVTSASAASSRTSTPCCGRATATAFPWWSARPPCSPGCATSSPWTRTPNCRATPREQFVGTMAHPLNRPVYDAARQRVVAGYGILQPGVSASLQGGQHVALCAPARRRAGHRPLHPHRLGRLPGRVPGGLVHRQGHLRRCRLRAGAQGALPGEPHPEPRPPGGVLRPLRVVERRALVRGVSDPLRRRRQPPLPLDSRRLAARRLAAAAGARPRRAAPAQSAVAAVALEAVRQPAPQPGAGGPDGPVAAGLDAVFGRPRSGPWRCSASC